MATGAEIIGTAFYHAFGYHTVDVYVAELDPAKIEIAPKRAHHRSAGRRAPAADAARRRRRAQSRRTDAERPIPRSRQPICRRRAARATFVTTARDRTIRTTSFLTKIGASCERARVFGAWLNHDDSRGVNSLDMLQTDGARRYVKHYMFDFGSIMGSGTVFRAAPPRRQRVHRRLGARVADPRDAWPLHARLAAHRLSRRAPIGRPVRRTTRSIR